MVRANSFPDALALEDAHALDQRRQLVADQAHDLAAVLAVVAVVDLADEAVVGAQAGDHGGALEDGVGAAAEVLASGISMAMASTPEMRIFDPLS